MLDTSVKWLDTPPIWWDTKRGVTVTQSILTQFTHEKRTSIQLPKS